MANDGQQARATLGGHPEAGRGRCRRFARRVLFWLKKFVSFWLMPLSFCVAAAAIGILLTRSKNPARARFGRVLALGAVAALVLFSNNLVSRWLMRPLETRHPAIPELVAGEPVPARLAACRYVVVLGGGNGFSPGVAATNLLSTSALSRVVEAVRLLRVLPEAKLVVSGPGDGIRPTHATVLARAAMALGIEADRVVYIDRARDTEDESRAVRAIVGDRPVALVTSAWHMPRSVALFRSAGMDPVPCPADFTSHVDDPLHWDDFLWDVDALRRSTLAVRERIGYLWIWLRGKA